jgi:molybdopterin-guanine dinucleotide biosynthesis protein A
MQHQKHTKLARPDLGHWGRREWAILGTTCGNIQALAKELGARLSARWQTAYVDADHKNAGDAAAESPFALEWTDKIGFHRLDMAHTPNPWERRALMNDLDVVLLNGNHFEGRRQILALDRRKFDSLSRKTERLTQVDLLLTRSGDPDFAAPEDLPDFLKQHLGNPAAIPVCDIDDAEAIAAFLQNNIQAAPLKALILAGGKSTRMGSDKADIDYHGLPQWQYLRNILTDKGLEIFISCREEQVGRFPGMQTIVDTFGDLGPLGAILSAFRSDPNAAWMVLACDLPLFDAAALRYLLDGRAPAAPATAFRQAGDESGFPEPLVAIWEPKIYTRALQFLAQGVNCPRKVLINSATRLLDAPRPHVLSNVNTPEERAVMLEKLAGATHTG